MRMPKPATSYRPHLRFYSSHCIEIQILHLNRQLREECKVCLRGYLNLKAAPLAGHVLSLSKVEAIPEALRSLITNIKCLSSGTIHYSLKLSYVASFPNLGWVEYPFARLPYHNDAAVAELSDFQLRNLIWHHIQEDAVGNTYKLSYYPPFPCINAAVVLQKFQLLCAATGVSTV